MGEVFTNSPLSQFKPHHTKGDAAGVKVEVIVPPAMVHLFAKKGSEQAVAHALGIANKAGKASTGKASTGNGFNALPLAPGQWLLVAIDPNHTSFTAKITEQISDTAYLSEQSDARVVFRVSGDRVRELMQKGCRLDLDASVTAKDWCAQTQMAQVGVILHQVDDDPVYDLYVYSGFARHFAEWLAHTGAQLGIAFADNDLLRTTA